MKRASKALFLTLSSLAYYNKMVTDAEEQVKMIELSKVSKDWATIYRTGLNGREAILLSRRRAIKKLEKCDWRFKKGSIGDWCERKRMCVGDWVHGETWKVLGTFRRLRFFSVETILQKGKGMRLKLKEDFCY
ncbi:hypothetical protein DL93DRAFT_2204081 [Clavulina sp. PMI_390]|nr:hypothetical protein DL93DRAFT_2204081 [Clavulina sp. PMI_390]